MEAQQHQHQQQEPEPEPPRDSTSFTDPCAWTTRHLLLTLRVDFESRRLQARVALTVEALQDGLSSLTLDTRDLEIIKATSNGLEAKFSLGDEHSFKGTPLTISLPFELLRGQQAVVEVSYATSPESSALQWLTAEQTAGKKHPYLFSQCQAIHCRSMVPCQDTPSVKSTYFARVSVPKELVALMSANRDGEMPDNLDGSRKIYCFRQTVPMPSYLIALVVGCLESRVIGPRSCVWSEKEMVNAAAHEFEETETMLKTAENLMGAYVWGQYDLLVLPPSFPYGGMENPCLTFVTPTLLAGDKSLSNVIAHEISHSWTGNLVTNKTWEHFWLNEGHTEYLERMIARCMYGEKFRQFLAIGGWKDLLEAIETFGPSNSLTCLVPDLHDTDPDDAFSSVPYEKGFALLYHLEELLGGPEIFMGFLKFYIQTYAYSATTTEEWKKCLYSYFSNKTDILNQVDWNTWFHSPGIPPFTPHYDTSLADPCICLCQRWIAASDSELGCFSEVDLKHMSSHQKIEFLSLLLQKPPLRLNSVKRMQEVYKFDDIKNAEIRFRWLRLCLRSRWEKAIPLALEMVTVQGRMKFTRPLYRDLYNFEKARQQAIDTFLKNKPSMHPITASLVAKDLHLGERLMVPCKDPSHNIQWLGQEALRRYMKAKADGGGLGCTEGVTFLVKRCEGQSLLDPNDEIKDVLQDKDFIEIVIQGQEVEFDPLTDHFASLSIDHIFGLLGFRPSDYNILYVQYIYVDGNSLSTQQLVQLGKGTYKIKLTTESERRVNRSRELVERIISEERVVYGINTGFGKFARTVIAPDKLVELQENVIHSTAVGVGDPLSPERCRMLLALRINVLAKGYSGISLEILNQLIEAFNASCLSYVPEKGTVGASGDPAPLAHLALGLMGEGKMWSPKSGWADAKYVLQAHGLQPISLKAKEGLSLINGTQMITSLGAEAVERATAIAQQADIIAALTLEVLKGTTRAFDSGIHELRPHQGQMEVATRMRSILDSDVHGSEISESHRLCDQVQDAYTLRCCPQVHGLVNDTIAFVKGILETEMNSVTDNPIVFAERGEIISGGNFHGEYPAKALDYLAIGVHELASISERRIERLCNPSLSKLPAFLVKEGGLNCGFKMAHCTAAALVSENKVLCHPSSVDSLSTSAATEDHVSMGGWAARKALKVIEHVEQVLAIELLAACQGLEFVRPLHTTEPLEKVYQLVRSVVKPLVKDRFMAPDIEVVQRLLTEEQVWRAVQPYMEHYRQAHASE